MGQTAIMVNENGAFECETASHACLKKHSHCNYKGLCKNSKLGID